MESKPARSSRSLWGLLQKGSLAVLDQGLFAGSNFIINVLLARWLVPDDFGAFTVAYTVFLLFGTVHGGLLSEPMLVFGPDRFAGRLRSYLRWILRGHGLYSGGAAILLLMAAAAVWAGGEPALAASLAILALAQGVILLQWLARHMCYVRLQPGVAAEGGVAYSVLLLGGAALLNSVDALNGPAALAVMGGASLCAAGWIFLRLRLFAGERIADVQLRQEAKTVHTRYGKWSSATGALEWTQGFLPLLLLPFFMDLEASGALRALTNFILPLSHVFQILGVLLIPLFVRARVEGALGKVIALAVGIAVAASVGYGLVLGLSGGPLVGWLYDGNYVEYAGVLWMVGMIGVVWSVGSVLVAVLRAAERPRDVFWARAAAAATMVVAGTALVMTMGINGALIAFTLAGAVEVVVILLQLYFGRSTGAASAPVRLTESCGDGVASDPESITLKREKV
ncbi:hypothetical protein BH23BAC4_BH23BAC4_05980 [soil metagenome]